LKDLTSIVANVVALADVIAIVGEILIAEWCLIVEIASRADIVVFYFRGEERIKFFHNLAVRMLSMQVG